MQSLFDALAIQGDDLSHWVRLSNATSVSADGRTIVGYGVTASGTEEAFLATLNSAVVPEPSSFFTCLLAIPVIGYRRRKTGRAERVKH